MRLHENTQLFADAIEAAARPPHAGGIGIKSIFIEKDYWICRALSLMTAADKDNRMVFKGGTSLTKAYGIGARFSEDIDIAVARTETLSGNQLKNLIRHISREMTAGLKELNVPGQTSKGSHYRKSIYTYPTTIGLLNPGAVKAGQLLIEINSFAEPYPCCRRTLTSFLTDFLQRSGNEQMIREYDMQPFEVNVLDKRRTMTEKTVAVIRASLADLYLPELKAKIRHFYDLHHLLKDNECREYLYSGAFTDDFTAMFTHDRHTFDKPAGWRTRQLKDSPLITNLPQIWNELADYYIHELPDLAYNPVPKPDEVGQSIQELIRVLHEP